MRNQQPLRSSVLRSRRDFLRLTGAIGAFGIVSSLTSSPLLSRTAQAQSTSPTPPNLPLNTWVIRRTPAFPASLGAPSKHVRLTYDTDRHIIYFWGGDYCVSNPVSGSRCASHEELWSYDVAQDKWQLLLDQTAANTPGYPRGRCLPGMAYDPKRKVVWMTTGSERYDNYYSGLQWGKLWAFDPARRIWSQEGPAPDGESSKVSVPSTMVEYMVYNPVSDALFAPSRTNLQYSLTGISVGDGISNDNWSISPFSAESPVFGMVSFAVDTRRSRAIVYDPYRGETWSYDFVTKQTARLSTQLLPARSVFGMVYDSANDVIVLFGGYSDFEGSPNATPRNDLWVFDFRTNAWGKPSIGGSLPSPRKGEQLVYDFYNNAIVQIGGTGGWQSGVDEYGYDGTELFLLRLSMGGGAPVDTTAPAPPTNVVVR